MADWKKIIVSGSNVHLNDITSSGTISGLVVTSSNLNPLLHFNGNRTVSNPNLPEGIYNHNFETDGDVTNFIDRVFFTNTPPSIPPSQSFRIQEWEIGQKHISPSIAFSDEEYSNPNVSQPITFTIENNPYFDISNSSNIGLKGKLILKTGAEVNKSLNTHLSASDNGDLYTYPLNVTVTDDVGASDTEKIYIHIIPNEKPTIKAHNGDSISLVDYEELNEYGEVKTIYNYTASTNRNESSGPGTLYSHFSLKYNDSNSDDVSFEGDYETILDTNGNQFINFLNQTSTKTLAFRQITQSFDYETQPFFNFTITGSDQHYPSQDTSSVIYIKYRFNITDNLAPTIEDQFCTINENSSNGQEVTNSPLTIAGNETLEDNTAFFLINNFDLIAATETFQTNLDYIIQPYNITNSLHSIEDSNYFNPTKDPFQINLTGNITKKAGAFLNEDIAKYYYYSASVTDIYNENQSFNSAIIRIEVSPDSIPTVTLNNSTDNYIIESSTTSNNIIRESHGDDDGPFSHNNTTLTSDASMNWTFNSDPPNNIRAILIGGGSNNGSNSYTNPHLMTGSSFIFTTATNISESNFTFDEGSTIKVDITGSKTSFISSQVFKTFTLNIAKNNGPTINTTTSPLITSYNLTSEGANLYSLTFDDEESNPINFDSFTLSGPQPNTLTQLSSSHNGTSLFIQCRNHLSASTTYNFTASIKDIHGFRTGSILRSFTVGAKNTGVLNKTGGTYYIIESALSGSSIVTDDSGIEGTGTAVSFSVDYSGGDLGGNPTVQSFTASVLDGALSGDYPNVDNMFSISSGSIGADGGLLTVKENVSESNFTFDQPQNPSILITYQDQYGNIGNDVQTNIISINPSINNSPIISNETPSTSTYFDYQVPTNTILKSYDLSDPESDTIETNTSVTLNTTNGLIVENTGTTLNIKSGQQLTVGDYHYTASINDIHNFRTSSVSGTISIIKNTLGTLTANTSITHNGNEGSNKFKFFIEEDGRSNDIIHTQIGENNQVGRGNQADLGVDYGSTGLDIQAFAITSTQVDINVTNPGGLLTLGEDVSGSFTPTQISNGTAIITASVSFTDNSPSVNTNNEIIYIQVFQNASLGSLTTNNDDTHNGKPLFYVEECGIIDDIIHTETGETSNIGKGSPADIDGNYIQQNHGGVDSGLTATNFETSSNTTPNVRINSIGNLTLGQNISGSDNNGGFTPSQITAGNAIFSVPVSFTDNNSNNITIHDTIYVKIFQNASLGTLTTNNSNTHLGKPLFYIQEYAIDNNHIHTLERIVGGNYNGNQAQLTGDFGSTGLTPINYSIISTTDGIDVNVNSSTGKLSIGENISGSVTPNQYIGVSASFQDNNNNVTIFDNFYVKVFDNASRGTLDGNHLYTHGSDELYYIQEAAKLGDEVTVRDGFTNGNETYNQGDLNAVYTNPNNSAIGLSPLNFRTSSHSSPKITVSSTGLLTLGEDISGSVEVNDIITVPIAFTDNGPAGGSGSIHDTIKVKVFANDEPNYSNEDSSGNTQNLPIAADTVIRTFNISDDEHDFPYTASLSGTDASEFYIDSGSSAANNEGTIYSVKALNTIENAASNQNLVYKIIVHDNVGKSNSATSEDIITNFSLAPNTVFAYSWRTNPTLASYSQIWLGGEDFFGTSNQNYLNPDAITNVLTGSILAHFQSGSLGNDFTPAFVYQNPGGAGPAALSPCVLINNGNLTQLKGASGIKSLGDVASDNNDHMVFFLFPSSSTLNHKPRDIDGSHNYTGGQTADSLRKYRFKETTDQGTITAKVIYFNTSESYFGHNTWGMIHTTYKNYSDTYTYELENTPQTSNES